LRSHHEAILSVEDTLTKPSEDEHQKVNVWQT
jgi:hypothetical protein